MFEQHGVDARMVYEEADQLRATVPAEADDGHFIIIHRLE